MKSNPADHASGGLNPQGLQKSSWLTGPAFLWKDKSCWPVHEAKEIFTLSEGDPEVNNKVALLTSTDTSFASLASRLEYFSDYHQAKKAVASCLLYIQKLCCLEKPSPKIIQARSTSQVASTKKVVSTPVHHSSNNATSRDDYDQSSSSHPF